MKIIYFHGLGGAENQSHVYTIMKDYFKDDIVLSPEVPHNQRDAYKWIKEYVDNEKPDMIVASSMGGFITLTNDAKIPTIVINPAMGGFDDIISAFGINYTDDFKPGRKDGSLTFTLDKPYFDALKEITNIYHNKLKSIGPDNKNLVYAIFSDNDEFFHHIDDFKKYYGDNCILIHDTHSITGESVEQYVIPYINKVLYNK